MVVFTCNHCGDSLKKPKVATHYQLKCRNAPFVTCVDCLKDFRDDEYVAHTKCITEAERYGASDYVPKPGANKGERKQQAWINVVNDLLYGTDLSNAERNFLNNLSKYENIPRKKVKFLNFVRNAVGNHVKAAVIDSVWDKMENAYSKQNQQAAAKNSEKDNISNQDQNKGEMTCTQNMDSNSLDNQNIAENQNNENICKENNSASHQNGDDKACEITNGHLHEKRNKSKKRQLESISIQSEEGPTAAKITKCSVSETSDNGSDAAKFHWKKTVLDILQAKGEMSLRKLQNKVMNKCIYYVFSLNDDTFKLTEYTKAVEKFNKTVEKLKESSKICISENKVKLL